MHCTKWYVSISKQLSVQDKRFAKALEVGLGISMGFGDGQGANDDGNEVDGPGLTGAQDRGAPGASAGSWKQQPSKAKEPEKAPEPELTEEERSEKEQKDAAIAVRFLRPA